MKLDQLALEVYNVRDFMRDAKGIAESLKKIRKIGYTVIECGGPAVPESEFAKMLADNGLKCCGYHGNSKTIRQEPEKAVEMAKILGTNNVICPYLPDFKWGDKASTETLVKELDAAGAKIKELGATFSYHNHALEFVKIGDVTMLDYIYAHTNPDYVKAELDTYWVHFGGGNVAAWCRKMKGRLPLLHIKDYGFMVENKPRFEAIGTGTLEWKEIIPAAEASGCKWFIVEQDVCPCDPFDAAAESFRYITENLIS